MRVSLDGGLTYQVVEEVRLIFDVEVPHQDDDEAQGQLHIRYNDEGVIHDVWCGENLDQNPFTESATISEVMDFLAD